MNAIGRLHAAWSRALGFLSQSSGRAWFRPPAGPGPSRWLVVRFQFASISSRLSPGWGMLSVRCLTRSPESNQQL